MRTEMPRIVAFSGGRPILAVGLLAVVSALLVVGLLGGATTALGADDPEPNAEVTQPATTDATSATIGASVSEDAYLEPVPGPDDPYFEAAADDGSWVSYLNPRDEYRNPYLGDGSGKICVTLLNEAGEPIVGESVPNTVVTVPTGEEIAWHSRADPMVVEYPLTEHYERPLDADQFGTTSELPQGDGYLDAHCIEIHGQPEDGTIEYGEAQIDGEHADEVEVVGYVQQANQAWDSDVDPIGDAVPYEEAGGWTYEPDGSHGQAVVVLQLAGDDADDTHSENASERDDANSGGSDDQSDETGSADSATDTQDDDGGGESDDGADGESEAMPGFGTAAALIAISVLALAARRR
jgi:PGF-CTERM protein